MASGFSWEHRKELYFAAASLEGAEREAFLSANCPDTALRREVERLLAATPVETEAFTLDSLVPAQAEAVEPASEADPFGANAVLGRYTIGRRIGMGGMGWVFEATDNELGRQVAIKVLPPALAGAPELVTRLRREAELASGLNHPNIVTVYEVARKGERDFIAMELVQGQTLREAISGRRLHLANCLHLAIQIADAMAAAHEANLVHRDLKPENIVVTPRGLVKVLDFGIAATLAELAAAADGSANEDVPGTLAYMSPEQLQGRAIDARSDIFAFGCVLYEMLTGQRAFHGPKRADTLEAVLHATPDPVRRLAPGTPLGLERLVFRCLQKDPASRWQNMLDLKLVLQSMSVDLELTAADPPPTVASGARPWSLFLAGLVSAGIVAALVYFAMRVPEPRPFGALRRVTAEDGLNTHPTISRDGSLVAYSSNRAGGGLDIWVQQLSGREPIRVTSDPGDETEPAISPDGTRIAYRSEQRGGGIYVVPALGGEPILVARGGRQPKFSPDGRRIAYWVGRGASLLPDSSHVYVVDAGGGEPTRVSGGMAWARAPIWKPSGDALVVLGLGEGPEPTMDWWRIPLDGRMSQPMKALGLISPPRLRVLHFPLDWLEFGNQNSILYSYPAPESSNLWELPISSNMQASGPPIRHSAGPGHHRRAAAVVAGDVRRIVFADETANPDVWLLPLDRGGAAAGAPRRLTTRVTPDWAPSISEDGRHIVFISQQFASWSIRTLDAETGRERFRVTNRDRLHTALVSGDGGQILYTAYDLDIFRIPFGEGVAQKICARCGTVTGVSHDGNQFLYEPAADENLLLFDVPSGKSHTLAIRPHGKSLISDGALSPDGKWAAFKLIDNPAGTMQVFVVPVRLDGPVPREQWIPITTGEEIARDPAWSVKGDVIYYTSERDGFRCIWAQRLDPRTRRPAGEPFAVQHFHSAAQSIRDVGPLTQVVGVVASEKSLVFSSASVAGHIWIEETRLGK